tara:strand:+ start:469 stop:723 length:255 start_codon:yes stop_codon:yes gene_type:complete
MKILKDIMDQWGFVNSLQLKELVEHFPRMPLVIKWGMRERELCHAKFVAERIAEVEAESDDYVREVFIQSENFRQLKSVLGVEQ